MACAFELRLKPIQTGVLRKLTQTLFVVSAGEIMFVRPQPISQQQLITRIDFLSGKMRHPLLICIAINLRMAWGGSKAEKSYKDDFWGAHIFP